MKNNNFKKVNKKEINWKAYIRFLLFFIALYSLYILKFPILFIILVGIITLLIILLKGKFYLKLNDFLTHKFHFFSKQTKLVKRIIVILIFIIAYIILKQTIFFILAKLGIDIRQIILNNLNQTQQ